MTTYARATTGAQTPHIVEGVLYEVLHDTGGTFLIEDERGDLRVFPWAAQSWARVEVADFWLPWHWRVGGVALVLALAAGIAAVFS